MENPQGHRDTKGARLLLQPVLVLWKNRYLIRALSQREIESRVRGTVLGMIWLIIGPLFMLSVYTLVFGVILGSRWQDRTDQGFLFPLVYFSGLNLFNFFFESISRAPNLMRDNQAFIKKIVFPVETFAYAAVGAALVRLAVGLALLALFQLVLLGVPPLSALAYPLLLAGLMLYSIGLTLAIAGLSVFFRDLAHMMAPLHMILMFLSPLFYPLSSVPEGLRWAMLALNPVAYPLEVTRNALFFGEWPDPLGVALYLGIGWLVALLGYRFFMRLRPGFADVI